MDRFLFRFGYEAPDEWRNNGRDGTDFESSAAVWVTAASAQEAEEIGLGYAERFVASLFHDAGIAFPGWNQGGYAMPWGPNTEADTTDFLRRAAGQAFADPRVGYELAITVRETSELVGAVGLHKTSESVDEAMLGYCLADQPGAGGTPQKPAKRCSSSVLRGWVSNPFGPAAMWRTLFRFEC